MYSSRCGVLADMTSVLATHLRAKYGDTWKSASMQSGGFAHKAEWLYELAIRAHSRVRWPPAERLCSRTWHHESAVSSELVFTTKAAMSLCIANRRRSVFSASITWFLAPHLPTERHAHEKHVKTPLCWKSTWSSSCQSCHSRYGPFLACQKIAHPLLNLSPGCKRSDSTASRASPDLTLWTSRRAVQRHLRLVRDSPHSDERVRLCGGR